MLDALSSETRRLTGRVPRAIARAAEARPEERAEVDGQGPATFTGPNRDYLDAVLGDGIQ